MTDSGANNSVPFVPGEGAPHPAAHGAPSIQPTSEVTPKTRGPQLSDPARLKQQSEHNIQPLTWRSFTIGLAGVIFISMVSGYIDAWMCGSLLAINHLPTNALFLMIFVLAVFNGGLRYFNRRWFHLEHSELMLIFAMTSVTAAIPVYGRMCYAVPNLAAGQHFKSASNHWEELIFNYYPQNNRNDGRMIHMDLVPEDPLPPVPAEFIKWEEYQRPASAFRLWRKNNATLATPPKPGKFKDNEGQFDRPAFNRAVQAFVATEGMPAWDSFVDTAAYDDAVAEAKKPAPQRSAFASQSDFNAAEKKWKRLQAAGPPEKMEFIRWELYDHSGAYIAWYVNGGKAPPEINGKDSPYKNLDGTLNRQKFRQDMLKYQAPPDLPDYMPFVDQPAYQAALREYRKMSTPISDFFGGVPPQKGDRQYRVRNDLNAMVDVRELDYGPWIMPVFYWSIFLMAMYVMMTSISALLRKQWVDRERLTFPLAQVPLEMVGVPNDVVNEPFFTSRWPFLIGFPLCLPLGLLGFAYWIKRVQADNDFTILQFPQSILNAPWVFSSVTIGVSIACGIAGLILFVPWILGRSSSFFRNPLTWVGILIPVVLHSYNILRDFTPFSGMPAIPLLNKGINDSYLTEPPWSAFGETSLNFYPSAVGLVYLLSLEVSFSIWFFYLVERVCAIFLFYAGYGKNLDEFVDNQKGGINSILIDQGFGALVGMVLFGLWMARRHLLDVFKKAVGLAPEIDDSDEAMSYRTGLIAFLLSFVVMVGWMYYAGISLHWALLFTFLVMVILIGLSRLVCEGGLFYIQCQDEPLNMIQSIFSPVTTGKQNVVMMGLVNAVAVFDMRATAMPPIFNAYKFCGESRLRLKGAAFAILVALFVSMIVSIFSMITLGYQFGANNLEGGNSWTFQSHARDDEYGSVASTVEKISNYEKDRQDLLDRGQQKAADQLPEKYSEARRDYLRIGWVVMGFVLVIVFMVLRQFIFWWPHPIGYISWCSPAAMIRTIASIFIGWLIKWGIVKYGGFRTYFKLRPLFVGLIAGECLIAIFWLAVKFCLGMNGGYPIHIN